MDKNYFKKCINKDTLQSYYPLMTNLDKLYVESLEDKKHVKSYKVFKNCVLLYYVSGGSFKQFYETQTLHNILNKFSRGE